MDLEIKETLRKIRRDKKATDLIELQPMDNMDDFRARPPSTTQLVIRRPTIQANNSSSNP